MKDLFYGSIWLIILNPVVLCIVGNLLVHQGRDISLLILSFVITAAYSKAIWFPVRYKLRDLDGSFCNKMGW